MTWTQTNPPTNRRDSHTEGVFVWSLWWFRYCRTLTAICGLKLRTWLVNWLRASSVTCIRPKMATRRVRKTAMSAGSRSIHANGEAISRIEFSKASNCQRYAHHCMAFIIFPHRQADQEEHENITVWIQCNRGAIIHSITFARIRRYRVGRCRNGQRVATVSQYHPWSASSLTNMLSTTNDWLLHDCCCRSWANLTMQLSIERQCHCF